MPLSAKGSKIMAAMRKQYGEKEGTSVFYASKNKGNISGVDGSTRDGQDPQNQAIMDALMKRLGGKKPNVKDSFDRLRRRHANDEWMPPHASECPVEVKEPPKQNVL